MSLLFEAELRAEERMAPKHIDALIAVVKAAIPPAQIARKSARSEMIFYKDERLLTVYSLQALNAGAGSAGTGTSATCWNEVLQRAFDGRFTRVGAMVGAHAFPDSLVFEKDLRESPYIRAEMATRYDEDPPHPVLYVRKWASEKIGKATAHWEGPTQVDARVVWGPGLDHQRLYVEAKFLSDVSTGTVYSCVRNQIARSIEAGLWDTARAWVGGARDEIDSEVISRFWFMMLTPRLFKTEEPTARLYGFLMDLYRRDPLALTRDLAHLPLKDEDWEALSLRLGWATWEDCRRAIVSRQKNDHPSVVQAQLSKDDFDALEQFYDQRRVRVPKLSLVSIRHRGWEQALEVEDFDDLKAQLRSRKISHVHLADWNPLTNGITHRDEAMRLDALEPGHLEWVMGSDHRMLVCR